MYDEARKPGISSQPVCAVLKFGLYPKSYKVSQTVQTGEGETRDHNGLDFERLKVASVAQVMVVTREKARLDNFFFFLQILQVGSTV